MATAVTVSIVIEWENVQLSEFERCRRMLDRLASQTERVVRDPIEIRRGEEPRRIAPFEIVVAIDPQKVDRDAVDETLRRHLPALPGVRTVRISAAPGQTYYGLKNHGADVTRGDIIVFLDSDVVPDDGWLEKLLTSFGGDVGVVAGNAYLEPVGLVHKAFAVYWFFPTRQSEASLEEGTQFFANNVAFERPIFERYRFEIDPRASRGACVDMARRMTRDGIPIYKQWGAQVSHPPPNGLRHFLVRGIAQGRDAVVAMRSDERRDEWMVLHAFVRFARDAARVFRRTLGLRRELGIRAYEVPLVMAIGLLFRVLVLLGKLLTAALPGPMARHFRI